MRISQDIKVRKWLEAGRSLTPLQALDLFGVMRLAAIIERLRREHNLPIRTDIEQRNGKRYARYSLQKQTININI